MKTRFYAVSQGAQEMKNNRYMTKVQAEKEFKELYNVAEFKHDRPAIRELWNNFVDSLHRDERISDNQAQNWDQPYFVKK
jgi:hypothetical protein